MSPPDRLAPAAREFRVVVNLRAQGEPEALRKAVEEALAALPAEVTMERIDSFRPSPPKPRRATGPDAGAPASG